MAAAVMAAAAAAAVAAAVTTTTTTITTMTAMTTTMTSRGFSPHHYTLVIISTFLARFMLISAFYADQASYKNGAVNAYHQVNAVLCLSARLMLISTTIWCVQCFSLWTYLEINLSRTDHFFIFGLSSWSFSFPPNIKHDVLDLSVYVISILHDVFIM